MRRASVIFLFHLTACGLAFAADGPDSFSREDIAKYSPTLALQLRSPSAAERQKALDIVNKVAQGSTRTLSDNLGQWVDPLIENENYDDVLNLTMLAIADRSFDTTTVEKLAEARVRALIGQNKLDQALIEAKSYYNICVLSSTPTQSICCAISWIAKARTPSVQDCSLSKPALSRHNLW